jgi:hypothetical protein
MGVGGGPRILEGVVDHVGADGVLLDVAEGAEEVGVAEEAGVEAVLPESAGAGEAAVEIAGVGAVDVTHCVGDRVGFVGPGDEVVVIGHQAVGEDVDVAGGGGADE